MITGERSTHLLPQVCPDSPPMLTPTRPAAMGRPDAIKGIHTGRISPTPTPTARPPRMPWTASTVTVTVTGAPTTRPDMGDIHPHLQAATPITLLLMGMLAAPAVAAGESMVRWGFIRIGMCTPAQGIIAPTRAPMQGSSAAGVAVGVLAGSEAPQPTPTTMVSPTVTATAPAATSDLPIILLPGVGVGTVAGTGISNR